MADPTNIAGLILTGTRLLVSLGHFWHDSRSAPEEVRSIWETVELLTLSAENVKIQLSATRAVDHVEERMRKSVERLANKCLSELNRLQTKIPKFVEEGEETTFERLKMTLVSRIEQESVRNILTGITACNSALHVALQALTIFEKEKKGVVSGRDIQGEWDSVMDTAQDKLKFRPFRGEDPALPEWEECLDGVLDSLREGASTHKDRSVLAAEEVPSTRRPSFATSTMRRPSTALRDDVDSGIGMAGSDATDDEPQHRPLPKIPEAISEPLLVQMLRHVDESVQKGELAVAANYQMNVMELRERSAVDIPVDTATLCRDAMKLASIYRRMKTPGYRAQAEQILLGIHERLKTEQMDSAAQNTELKLELAHDLGRLYLDLKRPDDAVEYLCMIFDPVDEGVTVALPSIISSGTMLYQIYNDLGHPITAQILDRHVMDKFGISLRALAWCQAAGFEINTEGFRFDVCAKEGNQEVRGQSPLHLAAKRCEKEVLKDMLEQKANPNVCDANTGTTPVLLSCSQQDPECLQLLLDYGGSVEVKDSSGRNGLHLCQRSRGGTKVARILLEPRPGASGNPRTGRIDINAKDGCDNTPLHLAASMGNLPMVNLLLERDATVDITADASGYTPLMAAVQAVMSSREVKRAVLKALVESGADPYRRDWSGQNAINLANDDEIAKMLRNFGKKPPLQSSPSFWSKVRRRR
ncbi:Ankyrin repeat and SAM domain-containing protein 6 [Madurella fahalii]|uniref:Ankyrin repeat and SAM domain-containing protein 6 n=1 Tax=Madurella fahalii TaxID=1157608 RepID=A0ABQ0GCT9_9PEZI